MVENSLAEYFISLQLRNRSQFSYFLPARMRPADRAAATAQSGQRPWVKSASLWLWIYSSKARRRAIERLAKRQATETRAQNDDVRILKLL